MLGIVILRLPGRTQLLNILHVRLLVSASALVHIYKVDRVESITQPICIHPQNLGESNYASLGIRHLGAR